MKRITRMHCTLVVLLAATSLLKAADPSFTGTWKLNLAKSQLSGTVYTMEKKASGAWHYSGGGFDTDFDLAGKEYTMPSGTSIDGKELSATSWELTFKTNGKVTSKSKVTVNGNTLNWVSDITAADGKTVQQTSADTRVSGGPGFAGKWKAGDVKGSATTLKIAMEGANGISIETPESQQVVKGSIDGKDYPMTQAGQATKITNAFTKTGNTLKVTTKMGGKLYYNDTYTLSADGKVLTVDGVAVATNEKIKSVFDRQ